MSADDPRRLWDNLPQEDADLIRKRQRGRAIVMGLLLGGLVVLIFAITFTKIRAGMHH